MSPLIGLARFRDPVLSASLALSALVSTVMMATLVIGPFYLARALGLAPAVVGIVMSVGPVIAALTGVPAGRFMDRFGAQRMTAGGLAGMVVGSSALCMAPATLAATGVAGYVIPIVIVALVIALGSRVLSRPADRELIRRRADAKDVRPGMPAALRRLGESRAALGTPTDRHRNAGR